MNDKEVRLIDANKLIREGWVLKKYRADGSEADFMSLADVPTAYDIDTMMDENALLRAKLNFSKLRGGVADD